jgi:hypothetical protein
MTNKSTNTFVMNGFKSAVIAAETLISFCNFLSVIHFPFDRKTKTTFIDADLGHFSNPNCAEMKTEPPPLGQTVKYQTFDELKTVSCDRLDQTFKSCNG